MSKVWFITGSNRGFGYEFVKAALTRGDRVAATSRNPEALDDLVAQFKDQILPLALDVTDRGHVAVAICKAVDVFGRIDVVINNAGYGLFGAVEEISVEQLRQQLEVNLFGVLNVVQEVVPILRNQGRGHIIQMSTIGGIIAFPNLGGYHASKWALEGLTESLAQEVAGFGIKVTLVEPGGYATDWAGSSAVHGKPMPEYDSLRSAMVKQYAAMPEEFNGDPAAAGRAILAIIDADEPPLRVLFGVISTMLVPAAYASRLETWKAWEDVSRAANGRGQ